MGNQHETNTWKSYRDYVRTGEMSKSMCLETELGLPGNPIQGQQKHSHQDRAFDGGKKAQNVVRHARSGS